MGADHSLNRILDLPIFKAEKMVQNNTQMIKKSTINDGIEANETLCDRETLFCDRETLCWNDRRKK
jgi:hypothetical protein